VYRNRVRGQTANPWLIKHTGLCFAKYLGQFCINEATVIIFIDSCHRHLYFGEIENNPDTFTQEQVTECRADRVLRPESYEHPRPPAMWSLGDILQKTEGSMHLSTGIQKATFKCIIRWATGHTLGSPMQRHLADNLRAIQDLGVAYCPCRPNKDEKVRGFTAEGYRAMTLTYLYIYWVLLETELQPKPPRGENTAPQKQWTREDDCNWMYLRGIYYPTKILLQESREQVEREMLESPVKQVINTMPEPVSTFEIRDLVWRQHNMFRAIFAQTYMERKPRIGQLHRSCVSWV
jgi:hypothetical protein